MSRVGTAVSTPLETTGFCMLGTELGTSRASGHFRVICRAMDLTEILCRPEGKTLEFKQDLSSPTPFLRSVVAFANTAGGRFSSESKTRLGMSAASLIPWRSRNESPT